MNNEHFSFTVEDQINSKVLKQLTKEFPVTRSSHLGNHYPSNLGVIDLGIKQVLYDRNTVLKDKNYHPSLKIVGHRGTAIGSLDSDRVSSFVPKNCSEDGVGGESVGSYHLNGLKNSFPGKQIESFSQSVVRHEDLVNMVLGSILELSPTQFDRFVTDTGEVFDLESFNADGFLYVNGDQRLFVNRNEVVRSALDLTKSLAGSLTDGSVAQRGGILFSNMVNILLYSLIDVVESGQDRGKQALVYHCSGPDMINYLLAHDGKIVRKIDEVYGKVRSLVKNVLPAMEMRLIPTADFRFVFKNEEQAKLVQEWYEKFSALRKIDEQKNEMLSKVVDPKEKKVLISNFNSEKKVALDGLKDRVRDVKTSDSSPLYDISKADFMSQYDLEQGQVYVPDFAKVTSFRDLKAVYMYNLRDIANLLDKEDAKKNKSLTNSRNEK